MIKPACACGSLSARAARQSDHVRELEAEPRNWFMLAGLLVFLSQMARYMALALIPAMAAREVAVSALATVYAVDAGDEVAQERSLIDRLQHYFLTYKMAPGSVQHKVEITSVYGREEAMKVILASHTD